MPPRHLFRADPPPHDHRHAKPPHHHHGPHHEPHMLRWMFNAEGSQSAVEFGRLLQRVGAQIEAAGAVSVPGLELSLPPQVYAVLRHERTPHNQLLLKLEAEWSDTEADSGQPSRDISSLVAPNEEPAE